MKWLSLSLSLLASCQAFAPSKSPLFTHTTTTSTNTQLYQQNDYNVVFRTSTQSDSFDSLKLGTARVHRYSDPNSGLDGDTEYIMWYHARDQSLNEAGKDLPPLSTGRIGRATSRNGLIWERDEVGSVDADMTGVSMGLNTESWWGFDTAHVGLGQVLMPMVGPAIRSEGGVYIMYYMGGSYEETQIGMYLEDEKRARVPEDAMIKGMKLKIGAAISQDGVTWGRVEGDDPSGACVVPYDAADGNVADVSMKAGIPEELYCGWPEVVVNPVAEEDQKKAAKDKKRDNFFMYYSTMLKDTKEKAIGYATSENGFAWTKQGIVLKPTPGTLDGAGCARCNVVKKATLDAEGFWKEDDSGWIMFYEGVSSEDGKHRILAAESDDLESWRKIGLVLDVGESGESWDAKGVGSPHVIRLDDGFFRMYYTGESESGETAIGVAKTLDLSSWVREQAELSFAFE
eukprot:scaffold2206_cov97-Skeletonema_dohrnii-CCMP3373.AAC.2